MVEIKINLYQNDRKKKKKYGEGLMKIMLMIQSIQHHILFMIIFICLITFLSFYVIFLFNPLN